MKTIEKFWLCISEYDTSYVYLFEGKEPQKGISESGASYWYVRADPCEEYPYEEWLGTRIPSWVMDELYRRMDIPLANARGNGGIKLEFKGDPDKMFEKIGMHYNAKSKLLELG